MIAFIAAKLIARGVGARFAKPLAWLLLVIGAALLLAAAWAMLKESIVSKHDAGVNLDAAVKGRAADAAQAQKAKKDEARLNVEARELERITDARVNADAAARQRAFYECVSRQREARANGRRPPAC